MSYNHNASKHPQVIKLYSWLAYDIFLTGLFAYSWIVLQIQALATAFDVIEKFILFLCTVAFATYRIMILHYDAEKKKLENRALRHDLEERKAKRS